MSIIKKFHSDLHVRDAELEDKSFIFNSFLEGLYNGNSFFNLMKRKTFMESYKHVLGKIITRLNVIILVMCLNDDPRVIVGYSLIQDGHILHWVFVKKKWRKCGVAHFLVPETINAVSHLSDLGIEILKKYPEIEFNPFFV